MSRMVRARYTLEYKLEAVRLVRGGQPIGAVARGLGISDQRVHNWVKAEAEGRLAATTCAWPSGGRRKTRLWTG